jgi:zinc D-Ala-D-Ala carboxypeptidase
MKLSAHFDLEEFTCSDTAARMCINNDLPIELLAEAKKTADMMEAIRAYLSDRLQKPCPVIITSAYRCPQLNKAIGSSETSDHIKMMACDFKAPAFGSPYDICRELAPAMSMLGIGQIIYEFESWIHVSTRIPDKVINRIITINKDGTHAGIVE